MINEKILKKKIESIFLGHNREKVLGKNLTLAGYIGGRGETTCNLPDRLVYMDVRTGRESDDEKTIIAKC